MLNYAKTNDQRDATLRAILDGAVQAGLTNRKAIGIAAETEDSMVARWLNGQQPKLRPFRRLISITSLLPEILKDQLWDWFCRGTGRRAVRVEELDRTVLDPNHDGIVDHKDGMCFSVSAIERGSKALAELCAAMQDGRMTEAEKSSVRALLYETKENIDRAVAAIDFEDRQRMRVAK